MSSTSKSLVVPVSFGCIEADCDGDIRFNIMDMVKQNGVVQCPCCHRIYQFDEQFQDKLQRLRKMVLAVRQAEDLLDSTNIGVTTLMGEVKLPYRLLLTRMTTVFSVEVEGKKVDFFFRTEPLNETEMFR